MDIVENKKSAIVEKKQYLNIAKQKRNDFIS